MARFRGGAQGNRGGVTRTGSANSGFEAFANGWNAGVRVWLGAAGDKDTIDIWLTSGSNHRTPEKRIFSGYYDPVKGKIRKNK